MRGAGRVTAWFLAVVLAGGWVFAGEPGSGNGEGRRPAAREQVEVRLLQVPFVVRDRRSGKLSSVQGLTLDDVRVRVDGKELSGEERRGLHLDEFCGPAGAVSVGPGEPAEQEVVADEDRGQLVILVTDFNYVDTRGRAIVARAIDDLAAEVEREGSRGRVYKVYGITGRVVPFTAGATADPAELRRAAEKVRKESWQGHLVRPGEAPGPTLQEVEGQVLANLREEQARKRRLGDTECSRKKKKEGRVDFRAYGRGNEPEVSNAVMAPGWKDHPLNLATFPIEQVSLPGNPFAARIEALHALRPAASLGALRAILLANAGWPGWKGVVLYTSAGFYFLDDQRQQVRMDEVLDTARGRFVLWTVDVGDQARFQRPGKGALPGMVARPAELLTPLARETGGRVLRHGADMSLAWKQLEERLDCYYVLSVPVEVGRRSRRVQVGIDVDRRRRPDLWNLVVEHPGTYEVETSRGRLLRRRVAALFDPSDFPRPRVSVEGTLGEGGRLEMRVRVPVADLAWEPVPAPGRGVMARLLVDALAEEVQGTRVGCRVDGGGAGRLLAWLPRPPREGDGRELVATLPCEGSLSSRAWRLRAAVTDLGAGTVGGAVAAAAFPGRERTWGLVALERARAGDLAWRPGERVARAGGERRGWVFAQGHSVRQADRLRLIRVACGEVPERAWVVLARATADGGAEVPGTIPPDRVEVVTGGPCPVMRVVLPEYSLEPGDWLVVFLDPGVDVGAWTDAFLGDGASTDPVLGAIAFHVE